MPDQWLDHINIRIPLDGVDAVREFYIDMLGFEPLKLKAYTSGDRTSFFVRINDTTVINFRPVETFQRPTGESFDHFCIVLDNPIEDLKSRLDRFGVDVLREGTPLGSTGRGPAVYVHDPFGYTVELKAAGESGATSE